MRTPIPTPTDDPLPFAGFVPHGDADTARAPLALDLPAIARFDALLHELHPDAARVDVHRVQHLVHWLLAMPEADAHAAVDSRMRRVDELRALLADPDWDPSPAMAARIARLLAYIDRGEHLLAVPEPMLGLLDDVLLIELAWPAFADEVEEYADFCDYRTREHPEGGAQARRAAWVRDRLAELALLRHEAAIADSHFIQRGRAKAPFRVA
jgi:hypothetical protein